MHNVKYVQMDDTNLKKYMIRTLLHNKQLIKE